LGSKHPLFAKAIGSHGDGSAIGPSAYSAGSRASGPHSADDSAQLLDAAPGQVGYVYVYMCLPNLGV